MRPAICARQHNPQDKADTKRRQYLKKIQRSRSPKPMNE
ncbi:hypothetical protein VDG1235_1556 [Verrucomicrobiia bacterium DG1235]|nr:hypothetical protein VDG1235_1556 [Verrucomicrobiae bacterium DG1235]